MNNDLFNVLNSVGKPYIVGSYAIFEVLGINVETKDTDILLETDVEMSIIISKLENIGSVFVSTNSFNGIKLIFNNRSYDIWRVRDTKIFEDGNERVYNCAEDVIKSFGFNLYQVAIRPDGEIYCTKNFIDYSVNKELRLINHNINNYKKLSMKAIENDVKIRRFLK